MPNHEDSYPPNTFKARKDNRSKWRWRPDRIFFLRCLWIALIFHQESYLFKNAFKACDYNNWASPALPTDHKIALIGDPQLVDQNTYSRRGPALSITKFYTDLYMRKNYKLLHHYFKLNTTIFTGDLFDGGREWGDRAWFQEYERFKRVFPARADTRVVTSLPGNHDIGFAEGMQTSVYQRFQKGFGPTSQAFDVGAWEVVLLDTVGLSSENKDISSYPKEWLADWRKNKYRSDRPKILITHVPLYREANAKCGPLRESNNSIKIQRGYQYQNVLDPSVSDQVWTSVKPSVIFAGDDHDYCDYQHDNGIHEINVKSFSWAMGIKTPGFQLISLSGTRYETKLCLLPAQLPIFGKYALLLAVSFSVLLVLSSRSKALYSGATLPRTNKDDDNKRVSVRKRPAEILKRTLRELLLVAWPIGIYYLYMIWY